MKNIPQNKIKLQAFLVWMKYLFFFGAMPTKEFSPYVFAAPIGNIELLRNAVTKFELEKQGVIAV